MSMALSNYLVSWVVTYLGDLQPTYVGVIIYLLSTMDIPVPFCCWKEVFSTSRRYQGGRLLICFVVSRNVVMFCEGFFLKIWVFSRNKNQNIWAQFKNPLKVRFRWDWPSLVAAMLGTFGTVLKTAGRGGNLLGGWGSTLRTRGSLRG